MIPIESYGYFAVRPNEPLEKRAFTIDGLTDGQVVVTVAGCGVCHTDLSFYTGKVKTKKDFPLVLGHEISGEVVAAGVGAERWMGKRVIVPAVLPCGECELCRAERDNICQAQKMPGNDFDGGFATHVVVPARFLCELPRDLGRFKLSQLSVIADAVTTPYQSLLRSRLKKGELAIVVGVGGIGTHMVEHAKAAGATVIAVDIDEKRLKTAQTAGADYVINSRALTEDDVKKQIRSLVKEHFLPRFSWKVFETSGTTAGQNVAFSLLSFAGSVGIVGFTMDKVNVRLSNMMAFDADLFGNWGCRPQYYPKVVEQVLSGKIKLLDYIEEHPLDSINEVFTGALAHKYDKRVILAP